MGATHIFPIDRVHFRWDRSLSPVLEIAPGDTVTYDLQEVSAGQITRHSTAADLARMDFDRVYPLAGPVVIKGARPGDTLEIAILELRPGDWGWTSILPGLGLLPQEEFPEPYLRIWDLSDTDAATLAPGIRIPLEPFCGTMGVAPEAHGTFPVMPPGPFGGNMDIRHLTPGSTLLLPVWVEGGLFSVGDAHAVQGDGEVCISAIECPMHAVLRFDLRRERRVNGPRYITPGPLASRAAARGYYATTGIGPDLMECARSAVREMIAFLTEDHALSRQDAYVLCSVAADLKISEVVDVPNWVVSACLPRSIFDTER